MIECRTIYVHPGQQVYARPYDTVIPIAEHPAIVADLTAKPTPWERDASHLQDKPVTTTVLAIYHALGHGPATLVEIAQASGLARTTVENCVRDNADLFVVVGEVAGLKGKRRVYALTEGARNNKRIVLALQHGAQPPKGDATPKIISYLTLTGPSTLTDIAIAVGVSTSGAFKLLSKRTDLFEQISAPAASDRRRRVLWTLARN